MRPIGGFEVRDGVHEDSVFCAIPPPQRPIRRVTSRSAGAAALLTIILAFAPGGAGAAENGDRSHGGWEFSVIPYFWLPSTDGTIRVRDLSADLDIGLDDVFDLLSDGDLFGGMGRFEARKGRLALFVDASGAVIDAETDGEIVRGRVDVDVDLDFDIAIVEMGAAYRFLEHGRFILEGLAGARYTYAYTGIQVHAADNPRDEHESTNFVDPFFGHDRLARQAEVNQDPLNHLALRDRREQAQPPPTLGAIEHVDGEGAVVDTACRTYRLDSRDRDVYERTGPVARAKQAHPSGGRIMRYAVPIALLAVLLFADAAQAASHSDAPLIKQDPQANITDVYAFVSPDALNVVVHVRPFSEPGDGPVYDRFADDALYSIHIADPSRRCHRASLRLRVLRRQSAHDTGTEEPVHAALLRSGDDPRLHSDRRRFDPQLHPKLHRYGQPWKSEWNRHDRAPEPGFANHPALQ